ncbi:putative steryl acetyl hydrolase mug81 [Cyberlindnera fabianii]|uniref:Putative steryl acetyl hydrolase mug81 n=1 Tax=Cyberlindnera fabianii TaxID=36022 RepID=A0A1V2KZW8_CYBFA|nr:putative steryl acetyl hydrolase mug81 [Cyberlindnera fabianii]
MPESTELASRLTKIEDPSNFDGPTYADNFTGFMGATVKEGLTPEEGDALCPKLDNAYNAKFFTGYNLNGLGKELEVPGIDKGRATFLIEAKDRTPDDPVFVFNHGGAYLLGLFPIFLDTCRLLYNAIGNDRLSILILDYTTSARAKYPTQLDEFSKTLNKLSESCNKIIIGGDSAGGHLSLSLLRHASYPVNGAQPLKKEAVPYATLLISPWVDLSPNSKEGTYVTNGKTDLLSGDALYAWGKFFSPDKFEDASINFHRDTAVDWTKIIPNKDNVFVYYGTNEVLAGAILQWANDRAKLDSSNILGDKNAVHEQVCFYPNERVESFNAIVDWFKKVLA